jgi:hypothetical protein
MQKSWYAVVLALSLVLLAAGPLLAAPPTVTLNLTGVGSGANLAGVYTSPYAGNINGGSTIPVICDDFADESFVPETWTAFQTSVSSLTSGTADTYLKWLNTSGSTITVDGYVLNQAAAYTVAAVLAIDILQAVTGSQAHEDLSYALWELFDPSQASAQLSGYPTDAANAVTYLDAAVAYVETNNIAPSAYSNVTIYSYDPEYGTSCGGGTCPPPPQEFITVNMPEPSSPGLLGLDLLGVAGLVLFVRRRSAGSANLSRS